ncbi:MAG: peptidase [Anaerolineae bacterium]|nr:peptidase [Anaerolineae bacterium]
MTRRAAHVLLLFLDGVGLGDDDPAINPFAVARTPALDALAGGRRWLRDAPRHDNGRAVFVPTDPRLGVPGRPQSASGQATILTGRNIPAAIGEHYGPRPNPAIRALVRADNLFLRVTQAGGSAALINGYPPRFHEAISSGKRLPSAYQEAVLGAGLPIFTEVEMYAETAMSPDWTGEGWRNELGYADTPLYDRAEAGAHLARLARQRDFTFFSHWMTDVVGHRGPLERGVALVELFNDVLAGLLDAWDDANDLLVITSDHGNLEDLSIRQHTLNDVPTVAVGAARHDFAAGLRDLTGIAPGVLRVLGLDSKSSGYVNYRK